MDTDNSLLVSVWMITFNHEKYIAQAIESVLNQATNFKFELVIGEDYSTDRTRRICRAFQQRYPDKIKLVLHERNVGIHQNIVLTLGACKGKYIAMLEGDDYWTDTRKLQKQVDFLDQHPDFVMCYQKTLEVNEATGHKKITNEHDRIETNLEEILERGWFMRTGSLVFRNGVVTSFPPWFFEFSSTDYMLHILIAEKGRIRFLDEVTSVYRRHEGGMTQVFQKHFIIFNEKKQLLLDKIDAYFRYRYHPLIRKQKKDVYGSSFIFILKNIRKWNDLFYLVKLLVLIPYRATFKIIFSSIRRKFYKSTSLPNV